MKKFLVLTLSFVLVFTSVFAQPKPKPASKPAIPELKKFLNGTGFPFKLVSDSMAVIPFGGANIEAFDVIVQRSSDLYIVYSNLTDALAGKIDETKYKYLLEKNNYFDIVKIGLSNEDSIMYVRADIYKYGLTSALLKRTVQQVGNVTNIICGDLK
jgi:hypothetical protein